MTANSGHSIRVTLVTREAQPLELFGDEASAKVAAALEAAGIEFIGGQTATVSDGTVVLSRHPSGSLSVDRIVALPLVRGLRAPRNPDDRPVRAHRGRHLRSRQGPHRRLRRRRRHGLSRSNRATSRASRPTRSRPPSRRATAARRRLRPSRRSCARPADRHRSVDPARSGRRCGRTREAARPLPRALPAPGADRRLSEPLRAAVELYWIPLGAGGHSVRFNGRVFEAIQAARRHRRRCDLYHAAIVVAFGGDRYTIEVAPSPDADEASRGVVGTGAVGSRISAACACFAMRSAAGAMGPFRTSPRRSANRAGSRPTRSRPSAPRPGRVRSETRLGPRRPQGRRDVELQFRRRLAGCHGGPGRPMQLHPPCGGRAPGWGAGLVVARRTREDSGRAPVKGRLIGSSVVPASAQPSRAGTAVEPSIDMRNTGCPRRHSSVQAAFMRSSRTPGQQAIRPGLSGWAVVRARRAPSRSSRGRSSRSGWVGRISGSMPSTDPPRRASPRAPRRHRTLRRARRARRGVRLIVHADGARDDSRSG